MSRRKINIEGNIPVTFLKEGKTFVAYSPVLDLSTCGATFKEAERNFSEALSIFFEECIKHNTLEKALLACGWKKKAHPPSWHPPFVVGETQIPISIPFFA